MRLFAPIAALMLLTISILSLDAASASGVPSPSPSPIMLVAAPSAPSGPMVAVAEPSAPPAWAQDIIVSAQKLPVLGPVISKAMLYLGILSSLLTLLAGFLISACSALAGAFAYAGFPAAVASITAFQSGRFMYWLKFFSMFNAKKPDPQ